MKKNWFELLGLSAAGLFALSVSSEAHAFGTGTGGVYDACCKLNSADTHCGSSAPSCGQPTAAPTQRVLAHPHVISVMWGNVWPEVSSRAAEFYGDLVSSPYMASLNSDYGVSTGSFGGSFAITPGSGRENCSFTAGCSVTKQDVMDELEAQIASGHLPSYAGDVDRPSAQAKSFVYMVHLRPGLSVSDGPSPCAWHQQMVDGNTGWAAPVAIMLDRSNGGCEATKLSHVNDEFAVASHELIEAAVNPYGGNGEVGDACEDSAHYGANSALWTTFEGAHHEWYVQRPWSWRQNGCMPQTLSGGVTRTATSTSSAAASRGPNLLDYFFSSTNGALGTAYWGGGSTWGHYAVYTGGQVVANSPIATTSRTPNNLDLFYIGQDGAVWTSAWSSANGWAHFTLTGSGFAPPGGQISAVSRRGNSLDVFVADNTGRLKWLNWEGNGWATHDTNASNVPAGAHLAAVARTNTNLDVFYLDTQGDLHTAYWAGGSWGQVDLFQVTPVDRGIPGGPVTAMARSWNTLDAFFVNDFSNEVQQASWDSDQSWIGFPNTGVFVPAAYTEIAGVTRAPYNLDLFYVDSRGVENMWWNLWNSSGNWGVTNTTTPSGVSIPSQQVSPIARLPGNLDVMEIGLGSFNIPGLITEAWSAGNPWYSKGF